MTEIPQSFVYTDALPTSGYSTVAVPGLVALLAKMHSEFGSVPFEQLTSQLQLTMLRTVFVFYLERELVNKASVKRYTET